MVEEIITSLYREEGEDEYCTVATILCFAQIKDGVWCAMGYVRYIIIQSFQILFSTFLPEA